MRCLGSDIELISEENARSKNPKAFLVLPWNFKDEIVKREKEYLNNGGTLMFPMPYPHIIDKNGEKEALSKYVFKNLWLKLTDSNEFRAQKFLKIREKRRENMRQNFQKNRGNSQKINNQKKLNFLHSGHAADIVNLLPVIKELSLEHECNLFIRLNRPLKFYYKHPADGFL